MTMTTQGRPVSHKSKQDWIGAQQRSKVKPKVGVVRYIARARSRPIRAIEIARTRRRTSPCEPQIHRCARARPLPPPPRTPPESCPRRAFLLSRNQSSRPRESTAAASPPRSWSSPPLRTTRRMRSPSSAVPSAGPTAITNIAATTNNVSSASVMNFRFIEWNSGVPEQKHHSRQGRGQCRSRSPEPPIDQHAAQNARGQHRQTQRQRIDPE